MATTPQFYASANIGAGAISAGNTNRDGTGTIVTIFTAASGGSGIDHIVIQATATVTAGVVRLFLHDGTNTRLWMENLIPATTPSTTVAAYRLDIDCTLQGKRLALPNGWTLRASTHNAEAFNVIAHGGNY